MITDGLYSYLYAHAAITDLVSDRIHPIVKNNDTLPAIIYTRVSTVPTHTMSSSPSIAETRIQVNCLGETYQAAKELADVVRQAIENYSGNWDGETVHTVMMDSEHDSYDTRSSNNKNNESQRVFGVHQDYIVWHSL
ncbi:MAG: DUF3168 domain-containing protein [FCB group bacterium]|nr:DUF3168 domain-containing protein [FCB group bacterium]